MGADPSKRRPPRQDEYPLDDEDIDSRTKRLLARPQKRRSYMRIAPDEARRVLKEFIETARQDDPSASPRTKALMRFAAAGFGRYLSGEARTLDHAFGLKKGRGAPTRGDDERWLIALAVREEMEKGRPLTASKDPGRESASVVVAKRLGIRESRALDAYVRLSHIIGIGRRTKRQPKRG